MSDSSVLSRPPAAADAPTPDAPTPDIARAGAGDPDVLQIVRAAFARSLRLPAVADDDDFFDLGGDSIMAVALLAEIHEATGQDVPLTAIFDASTVAALAALVGETSAPARPAGPLILLRAGAGTPLFVAHGLGGSAMELRDVARRIETDAAIYGLQARGLDGEAAPLETIEAMAAFYLSEIRRVQPAGPYRLAGFSFGGLVALEIALGLRDAGETVERLIFLDTFPHTRFWPLTCRVAARRHHLLTLLSPRVLGGLATYHRHAMAGMSVADRLRYVAGRARRALALPTSIFRSGAMLERFADAGREPAPRAAASDLPAPVRAVQRAGERAFAAYCPRRYDGAIDFVKAAEETKVPFDARLLWERLSRAVRIYVVPGTHQGLVRSGVDGLARCLSGILACAGPSPRDDFDRRRGVAASL